MLEYIFSRLRLISDRRNMRLFFDINKEFSKDKSYSLLSMIKAVWLVSKDEKIVKFGDVYVTSSFLPPLPTKAFSSVFEATLNIKSKFYEHSHAIRSAPISVFFSITKKCQYSCWHCSRANVGEDMSFEVIKKTIGDLQDMGVAIIGITGGEPLLREDLVKIIKSIDDHSISYIFTTGQTLTLDRAKELKKAGLFGVGVSLDHYDKQTHDKMRGKEGAYDNALKAIEYFKQAGVYTMIQTVTTKQAIKNNDMWEMIKLAKKLGVNEIRFLEPIPTGKIINSSSDDLLTKDERQELINIHIKANRLGHYPKVSVFAHTESPDRFGCGAGTQHSYIDSQGNLYPCDFVPLSFGNVQQRPVNELWKEMNKAMGVPRNQCMMMESYEKIRESSNNVLPLDVKDSKEICSSCKKVKSLPGFYRTLAGNKTEQ